MIEIKRLALEFDDSYAQYEDAVKKNDFHEASDMQAYLLGLTKGMIIILESNPDKYEQSDRTAVDTRISQINRIDNVEQN